MRLEISASLCSSVHLVPLALLALFAAAPAYAGNGDWRGFYFGGSAGYGFGASSNRLAITDGALTNCHFCDNIFGGGPTVDHLRSRRMPARPTVKPREFGGGLQAWIQLAYRHLGLWRSKSKSASSHCAAPTTPALFCRATRRMAHLRRRLRRHRAGNLHRQFFHQTAGRLAAHAAAAPRLQLRQHAWSMAPPASPSRI